MKKPLIIIFLALFAFSFTPDKPAYVLYEKGGKEIKYAKMMADIQQADMVFFGELHTDPISHWMEFEITKDLYAVKKKDLVIGAEMFESDIQVIIDEYLNGFFADKKFEGDARLWKNYKTDYKPIVEFAKDSGVYVVATNIPRRYASVVHKKGFEGLDELSEEGKNFIAPLPIKYDPEVACYKNMLAKMGMEDTEHSMASMKTKMPAMHMKHEVADTVAEKDTLKHEMVHNKDNVPMHTSDKMPGMNSNSHFSENLPKAQAAKDATMAHFIMQNWESGKLLIHYNGSYHSENHEGIVWYLMQEDKSLAIKTIAVVYQDNIDELEADNKNLADYLICVPSTMTQTSR